jgi:hypothetical protein
VQVDFSSAHVTVPAMGVRGKEGARKKMDAQQDPMRRGNAQFVDDRAAVLSFANHSSLASRHCLSKVRHAARIATSQLTENNQNRTCYPETHFAVSKPHKSESPAKISHRWCVLTAALHRRNFSPHGAPRNMSLSTCALDKNVLAFSNTQNDSPPRTFAYTMSVAISTENFQ